jgi:hypothetical protein
MVDEDELSLIMRERGVAFVFLPQVSRGPDGRWRAAYPAAPGSVIGESRAQAVARLRQAALDRARTHDEKTWQIGAVREHLAHGLLPGVDEIAIAVHERIMHSANPQLRSMT